MFEKIKEWFNEVPVPPAWVQSIQSMILTQDALLVKQRDRISAVERQLEQQLELILKTLDADALVVANLTARVLELEADKVEEDKTQLPIAIELKVPFKVGDKVRVQNYAGLGDNFDGKTGRVTSTKFSDSGTGYVLYSVRFPRKIHDSAIHEFYDDEIELVEE
jgi:hypothetical protein